MSFPGLSPRTKKFIKRKENGFRFIVRPCKRPSRYIPLGVGSQNLRSFSIDDTALGAIVVEHAALTGPVIGDYRLIAVNNEDAVVTKLMINGNLANSKKLRNISKKQKTTMDILDEFDGRWREFSSGVYSNPRKLSLKERIDKLEEENQKLRKMVSERSRQFGRLTELQALGIPLPPVIPHSENTTHTVAGFDMVTPYIEEDKHGKQKLFIDFDELDYAGKNKKPSETRFQDRSLHLLQLSDVMIRFHQTVLDANGKWSRNLVYRTGG